MRYAVDQGCNLFDTAEAYNGGASERALGDALRGIPRQRVIVCTKISPSHTAPTDVMAHCVARTGWHGDVFAMPRETFGDSEAEPVIFQTAAPDGVALGQARTLARWTAAGADACVGNSRRGLALSVAFAGP